MAAAVESLVASAGSQVQPHESSPNSIQADWSVLEVFACEARLCNVVRSAVLSGGWWRDVEAGAVDVAVAVAAAAAAAVVVAVDTESSQALWHCGWAPVVCLGQRDFGGTSNDTRRTLMQGIREKRRGKPQQPVR